ncbi:acylphosphatase [Magnetovibrio sp.]|uniref:acylphosphatase n=1 Tax=Magnetovibrio sp. TaxID=2024836 RepID=UPI002F92A98C
MNATTVTVHAIVSGRVQGVWYRAWTQKTAQGLGLSGWVRNCSDGTVEALFSGPGDRVGEMLRLCRKGPMLARVDDVRQTPAEAPEATGFLVLENR